MNALLRRFLCLFLALTMIGSPLAVCAEGLTDEPEETVIAEETTEPEETEETEIPETTEIPEESVVPEETEEPEESVTMDEPVEELPEAEIQATVASGTCGDNLTWALDDNGTLTISGTGAMYDYYAYGESYVSPWYSRRSSVKTVVIEDTVTSIGSYAFNDCSNLTSVSIGNGITNIDRFAFLRCVSLTSVTIPDSVTSIGDGAFTMPQPDERNDSGQRTEHRVPSVPFLLQPDKRNDSGQRNEHRVRSVLFLLQPDKRNDPGQCNKHQQLGVL